MAEYNAEAIQAAIDRDPAIGPAEAKAIHALLKGRTGRGEGLQPGRVRRRRTQRLPRQPTG